MNTRPRVSQVWTVSNQKWSPEKPEKYQTLHKSFRFFLEWESIWIIETLKAYCKSTGLHGLNYIIRKDSSRGEKIGWTVVVVVAIIVSIVLLWISATWSAESPTVTVIESTHFATWGVPFPAVTLCNFNKVSMRKANSYAKILKRPANVSENKLASLLLLAVDFAGSAHNDLDDYFQLGAILDDNGVSINSLRETLAPECNEMILRCTWKGTQTRCDTLFQKVNSSLGICCSFNYYGTSTNNYPVKIVHTIPRKPRRVTASGYQTGLTALLDPMVKDYFGTFWSGYGFHVFIHDAYDFPSRNAETKIIFAQTENFISVTPESTYATNDVRSLDPHKRNCLFATEMKLSVMERYSFVNCMSQCRAELFYKACGCVPPASMNNGSYPSCTMDRIECVIKNMKSINGAVPGLNATVLHETGKIHSVCSDCLPDCELNQYPAEIATGFLNRKYSYNSINFFKDITVDDKVIVNVFFNDLISSRYRKDIFQNWISLLASFGGLLGLIIGFSIVTAFEFIYYLTLRPLFAYLAKKIESRKNKLEQKEFEKWNRRPSKIKSEEQTQKSITPIRL